MDLFTQLAINGWRERFKNLFKKQICDCKICQQNHNIGMTKKAKLIWWAVILATSLFVGIFGGYNLTQ